MDGDVCVRPRRRRCTAVLQALCGWRVEVACGGDAVGTLGVCCALCAGRVLDPLGRPLDGKPAVIGKQVLAAAVDTHILVACRARRCAVFYR